MSSFALQSRDMRLPVMRLASVYNTGYGQRLLGSLQYLSTVLRVMLARSAASLGCRPHRSSRACISSFVGGVYSDFAVVTTTSQSLADRGSVKNLSGARPYIVRNIRMNPGASHDPIPTIGRFTVNIRNSAGCCLDTSVGLFITTCGVSCIDHDRFLRGHVVIDMVPIIDKLSSRSIGNSDILSNPTSRTSRFEIGVSHTNSGGGEPSPPPHSLS